MEDLSKNKGLFKKLFSSGKHFKNPHPQKTFKMVEGDSAAICKARQVEPGKRMPVRRTKYI